MSAGVKHLLKSLERAMGMEDAKKKRQVQEFFYKKLQRRPGQPMAEWVNVFENAALDMKAEGPNVELQSMGWHFFEKSNLTLQRQERVLRQLRANKSSPPFEERWSSSFLTRQSARRNDQFQIEGRVM